jgi:hypothetical protein
LGRVKVHLGRRFYALGLTDQMRTEIAADVVQDMRQFCRWAELDDPALPEGPGSSGRHEQIKAKPR